MMFSLGGHDSRAPLLEALPGTVYEFRPLPTTSTAASEAGHQTTTSRMCELIIRAESRDCGVRHDEEDARPARITISPEVVLLSFERSKSGHTDHAS